MIPVRCPRCQASLHVGSSMAGEVVACPECGQEMPVPGAPEEEVPDVEAIEDEEIPEVTAAGDEDDRPRPRRPRPPRPKKRRRIVRHEEEDHGDSFFTRNRIMGSIGAVWGLLTVLYGLGTLAVGGKGAFGAGIVAAMVFGALMLVVGLFYLLND